MTNHVHLLNGDALLMQFPEEISGKKLVCRECLVEGPVERNELAVFFNQRAKYLNKLYQESSVEFYTNKVASQFYQLLESAKGKADLYLWFEDDLFCQVNLWFSLSLLNSIEQTGAIYLIRPPKHTPYGFGGLNQEELVDCFKKALPLTTITPWVALWEAYQTNDLHRLHQIAESLTEDYPFVLAAVEAHVERFPTQTHDGRPKERLKQIIKALNTTAFAPVFREFCRTEAIYGFGDVTVKRLFDEVVESIENNDVKK